MGLKIGLAISGAVIIVIIIIVVPTVLLTPRTKQFRAAFMKRCEEKTNFLRCESLLRTFEETYVGQDKSNFLDNSYDDFFEKNPFTHSCGKTMFWSNTKELVHKFTENKNFITLEDTLLGHIMDGLTWYGKKGSKETFNQCCENCKPKSSFWEKASAKFAEYACGDTTVMLCGKCREPYDPNSNFAKIEVKKLKSPRVKSLKVIFVTEENDASCSKESLQELRNSLDRNIQYNCQTVTESRINKCIENGQTDSCWSYN